MRGLAELNNLLFLPKASNLNKCIERNSTKQRSQLLDQMSYHNIELDRNHFEGDKPDTYLFRHFFIILLYFV